jgi:hypothetical protein
MYGEPLRTAGSGQRHPLGEHLPATHTSLSTFAIPRREAAIDLDKSAQARTTEMPGLGTPTAQRQRRHLDGRNRSTYA